MNNGIFLLTCETGSFLVVETRIFAIQILNVFPVTIMSYVVSVFSVIHQVSQTEWIHYLKNSTMYRENFLGNNLPIKVVEFYNSTAFLSIVT